MPGKREEGRGRVKIGIAVVMAFLIFFLFFSITLAQEKKPGKRVFYLGMILGSGGLGDRSFNDSAYKGLRNAQVQYGIRFEIANFGSDDANLEAVRGFALDSYDLIIGIGFENRPVIEKVAREFPDTRFALIDVVAQGSNIASIVFREQEGDFLMGVLAAMLTESKTVGFIGGMDIPPIRRIESGFRQGVYYQDPDVTILADLAGSFSDPDTGMKLALSHYDRGADIIYNAAGRTGLGIIEAAKKRGKLTIGTSGDQRYLAPGNVVGNRPKRVDAAVFKLVEEIRAGDFKAGIYSLGLKEGGLSIGPFDESIVTRAMRKRLKQLEHKIVAGGIVVRVDVGE